MNGTAPVKAHVAGLGDNPSVNDLIGSVKVMLKAYDNGEIDRLYLVYNKFVNTMVQQPRVDQLLPLPVTEDSKLAKKHHWITSMSRILQLLDTLLIRYVESQVYQGSGKLGK